MIERHAFLSALQHADSFFPGGGVSFSWGLEGLHRDGFLNQPEALDAVLRGQLRHRWATCDRPVMLAACAAEGNVGKLGETDRLVEAVTLPRELRDGSKRAGNALLSTHVRLGTPGASQYRAAIASGAALGHLPVVQGCVWSALGIGPDAASLMSGYLTSIGFLGAAVRLGAVGHLDAQRILVALQPLISDLASTAPPPIEAINSFTPAIDIGSMHHERGEVRLFAN
jgi:urease accessory protein